MLEISYPGLESSPRLRGCFLFLRCQCRTSSVFPAPAGVFPVSVFKMLADASLPRACGGVSAMCAAAKRAATSSPRLRGCFHRLCALVVQLQVFPAPAGVFPACSLHQGLRSRLPRACGGVSEIVTNIHNLYLSSPRLRGCFRRHRSSRGSRLVFPAPAGVFLQRSDCCNGYGGLPRACGGVSL